nr:MAG TPA: hypothetical protein [Caudoviricetes sp.]
MSHFYKILCKYSITLVYPYVSNAQNIGLR